MRPQLFAPAFFCVLLTGCGGGGGTVSGVGSAVTWNPVDACTFVAKDKVGAIMGSPVQGTSLEPVVADAGNGVSFSNCNYTLTDGRTVGVMTRNSTDAVHTPAEITTTRTQLGQMMPQTFEDVPGLGSAAYWAPATKQLNVYLDEHRWLIVTLAGAGTGPLHMSGPAAPLKPKAIALAHAGGI